MRFKAINKASAVSILLLVLGAQGLANPLSGSSVDLLPQKIGEFRQLKPLRQDILLFREGILTSSDVRTDTDGKPAFSVAEVDFVSTERDRFLVEVVRLRADTEAYSLLTLVVQRMRKADPSASLQLSEVGTAGVITPATVVFFKGPVVVRVSAATQNGIKELVSFSKLLAQSLDAGEGDIPAIVKHLPDWENAQNITHAVTLESLKTITPADQPVLDTLIFDSGTEAVVANYGTAQMVIVEFTTPQIAGDNDSRIAARLQELQSAGLATPSAYRRIGNYSVFVFGASDETAKQLLGQVKYEKVVQWLGENPYWYQQAERKYLETTAGVLVTVIKASGLTLMMCLAIGGFLGALLFSYRRRQRSREAFSDAGGMLRLNLDDMTAQRDPRRLIGKG